METTKRLKEFIYSGQKINTIVAISLVGLMVSCGLVVAQDAPLLSSDTKIFVQSRFILWEPNEKMIDDKFNITLISFTPYNKSYIINIDNNEYKGNFINISTTEIFINNSKLILFLRIYVNESLIYEVSNIRVVSGISASGISQIEPYTIDLLPFELTKLEWNLIYSGIVAFILCLPTAYFLVKYYRKRQGARRV